MKIGIWGNYCYGNFGDDLMAVSIANYLKRKGHQPIVYRLDYVLASLFNIEVENSVLKLVEKVDFLFIGGGGMLVVDSFLRQFLSPVARSFERDFKEFNEALDRYKKNVYPISIGGNGNGDSNLPRQRKKFFSSSFACNGTLRLKGDLMLTKTLGKEYTYIPDILLGTANQFRVNPDRLLKSKNNETWIGLNLLSKSLKDETWCQELIDLANKNSNIKLFFIKTHLENYPVDYEYLPDELSENVKIYQYANIEETLTFLASLDFVISSKLHVGLTALSLGTPFLSFKAKKKTLAQLKELGAEHAILHGKMSLQEIANEYFDNNFRIDINQVCDMDKLHSLKEESKKHYQFVDQAIEANS
ncbi:polysaccharide pyruvyl transferase family protein [Sunxiuqinia rutila]|uniref:polysaccharide pyruvyl transferase family protein n=1 Tax=Sunxiuqinia rutila TaxID=1397841 RepID=UPI003D36CD16